MKVNLGSWIQGRSKILATLGLFSLVGISAGLQNYSSMGAKVLALQEGLQTCFTRVHNTYTARLIGSGSNYLSESFVANTEECFGEAIRVYENLNLDNGTVLEDLNAISTDVSWFHQKATAKAEEGMFDGSPEDVILSNMSGRFEKLEIKKEQVNEGLTSEKNQIQAQKAMLGSIFYFVAAIVPLFIGLDYFRQKRQEDILGQGEKQAKELLSTADFSPNMVRDLIVKTLTGLGLRSMARLYEVSTLRELNGEALTATGADENTSSKDEVGKPILVSGGSQKQQIDKIWNEDSTESQPKVMPDKKIKRASFSLEDSVTNVIDIVSSKIFTQGINLDTQTEDVTVYGEQEAFEQALYNLMTNAIENYNFDDPHKYLSLTVRKLGSTVLFDLFDSGREFSKEFLRQAKGLATGMVEHTELAIAQCLVEDFSAKISFENVANEDGAPVGRKAQIVLEAVATNEKSIPKRRLARVEKSTKKELLKRLQEAQNS
jgi:hypothetical protein